MSYSASVKSTKDMSENYDTEIFLYSLFISKARIYTVFGYSCYYYLEGCATNQELVNTRPHIQIQLKWLHVN